MADFGNAARQVASLVRRLQRFVDGDYLIEALAEVAGPHLILNVFVPDSGVDDRVALHAAGDFIEDVTLTRILCQVVSELVL